ncbi:MAG: type II toxin-antitoxin system VapC family toxin [Aquificae bacterium]|nr:type II toxin-antitoxin system VapC family toxin [Aquificota bacterium]
MNIIIDTHIFLWLLFDTKRIKQEHLKLLKKENVNLYLSSISLVEIAIKKSVGKLEIEFDLELVKRKMQLEILEFDEKSAIKFYKLPMYHKDPFDRMIIAQALAHDYTILTYDEKFRKYGCRLIY